MKRWMGYVMTALRRAFIRPIWGLNDKLGPLATVLPFAAALIIGFVTKNVTWGLVGLVGGALVLTFSVLVVEVAHEAQAQAELEARPPTPVSAAHQDQLKRIAQSYRSAVPEEECVTESGDDWQALVGHFPEVADLLRDYKLSRKWHSASNSFGATWEAWWMRVRSITIGSPQLWSFSSISWADSSQWRTHSHAYPFPMDRPRWDSDGRIGRDDEQRMGCRTTGRSEPRRDQAFCRANGARCQVIERGTSRSGSSSETARFRK